MISSPPQAISWIPEWFPEWLKWFALIIFLLWCLAWFLVPFIICLDVRSYSRHARKELKAMHRLLRSIDMTLDVRLPPRAPN